MPSSAKVTPSLHANCQYVETRFDPECGVYWAYMKPMGRQCFTTDLLADLYTYIESIVRDGGVISHRGDRIPVRYGVLASKAPGVFNLGGDLELFRRAIQQGDRNLLLAYGEKCINNLHPWHTNCGVQMTTMSLVQGDALGGGFEAALSASVLIAEEGSRMGFPEILFNLFPGMGAFAFIARRAGRRIADELIASGNIYTARQLYDMGVVDVVTPEGTGEAAVYSYIKKHGKSGNGRRGYERARLCSEEVSRKHMLQVVGIWADTALRLSDRDVRMMDRLVRAQHRLQSQTQEHRANALNVLPLQRASAPD